jgi:hypothetical protein
MASVAKMTDLPDLVAFVRACLDDDERVARDVDPQGWTEAIEAGHWNELDPTEYAHIARHDPARVLSEVAAKRALLELHDGEHYCPELKTGVYPYDWPSAAPWGSAGEAWRHASSERFEGPCPTLRLLAQPFAGRPSWREEWAT